MGTQENVATSASDELGDLGFTISDETPSQCMALAKSTGKRCKKTVSPGSEFCSVHQQVVGKQSRKAHTKHTPLRRETAKEPGQVPTDIKKKWKERYAVSVIFKSTIDEHGEEIWQTRVLDDEDGEELPGIETAPWVNWILERAGLPDAAKPISSHVEAAIRPLPVAEHDARIEILEVELLPLGPSPDVPEKQLRAGVRFRVSGTKTETMAAEGVPFWIQFHLVNLESGAMSLVASDQSQLQPEIFEYTSQQSFLIPDLGRYELQTIVLLLPPGERIALYQGPTLKIIP